ncbi:MAG TPA: GNAT family N-acetyltransferase [Gemmatimonadaceae bacterium]|nr:GNAT family N-acetyltransferase [Gemmatimonadaceae bacterium]
MIPEGSESEIAVSVRPARILDADDVARLTTQLGYDAEPSTVAATLARIQSRRDQQFFVAELEGRPVGWLHALIAEYVETGAFVVIGGLVVDSNHRRKGVGSLLMEHAEVWAKAQGCSIVRLSSSTSRTAAHQFYQERGYAKIKTQYSFMKSIDGDGTEKLLRFIPRLAE